MEQNLSQVKIVEYLTIISENYGRQVSEPLQEKIITELQHYDSDQIERGFKALLREYERMPNLSVMLKYVKGAHQFKTRGLLPDAEPSRNDRHMVHLFFCLLAENIKNSKPMHYIELLDEIERRAIRDKLPLEYIDTKMNRLLKIFRADERGNAQ